MIKLIVSAVSSGFKNAASTKRLSFLLAVLTLCSSLLVITGIFVGLAIAVDPSTLVIREFAGTFEIIAGLLLAATTTGYVGGKIADKSNPKDKDE